MAMLLNGAPVAETIHAEIRKQLAALSKQGITPRLAIVRVGAREDDVYYAHIVMQRAKELGVSASCSVFSEDTAPETVEQRLREINADADIHGCLLLRPLPPQFPDEMLRNCIATEKDVDGVGDASLAAVFIGEQKRGYPPCTAEACIRMLDYYGYTITGARALVIGRSLIVGKPVAMLLLARNATVTMAHSKSAGLPGLCRNAELIIAAAGKKRMLNAAHLTPAQTVIDVGIHSDADGSLCGDVDFSAAEGLVSAITPVPGGLGTVTTALLIQHCVQAAARQTGLM